ncbi:DNA polymerase V [Shewanella algicola]|uniref:Translesion error-prone DNA polymerase V autoproteolytic subunit n=1 Tax=Shewanella algicola TaxID=640633 RepID=A0A9X1Z5B9_9GAMM|nr:translesion error-prone DNA polymerase V autoproteolytic subunit [Shewanella algicola]MCL1105367.1 translesion error-prone DNA polymerase V autoproteolytic subunit [Shewanella algicola]GGP56096.1 DNA polymerase V [Shewanella algicola]
MKVIPIYIAGGISGFESPAAEYQQRPLSLDELLITHPSATFIGKVQGDSMIGIGIFDGDLVIVDRSCSIKNGQVIVANLNGEFVCKMIDLKRRLLLSSNDAYPDVVINQYDDFSIEGCVVYSIRCHDEAINLCSH